MRIALTTVLMMAAALAFADEPSAPESKTEAPAESAADKSTLQAAQTEATARVSEEEKPFKPPAGYKPKRVNGELVYCTKTVILGSKFPIVDCRNEAQLKDMERNKRTMREDLNRARTCSGGGCNAN
jgi:hypothetical protein